jgi:hypothetical protein
MEKIGQRRVQNTRKQRRKPQPSTAEKTGNTLKFPAEPQTTASAEEVFAGV